MAAILLLVCGVAARTRPSALVARGLQPLARGVPSVPRAWAHANVGIEKGAAVEREQQAPPRERQHRRFTISAEGDCVARVDDLNVPANASLGAYMTLPPEEWNVLDEKMITRLPLEGDGASVGDQRFLFSVPWNIGQVLTLCASCTVDVRVDRASRTLHLTGRNATVTVINESLSIATTPSDSGDGWLSLFQETGNKKSFARDGEADGASDMLGAAYLRDIVTGFAVEVDFATTVKWRDGTGLPESVKVTTGEEEEAGGGWLPFRSWDPFKSLQQAQNGTLACSTKTTVAFSLPVLLDRLPLPPFVLKRAAGLVLKLLTKAMVPQFGKLLTLDYLAWSRGKQRNGGELLAGMLSEPGGPDFDIGMIQANGKESRTRTSGTLDEAEDDKAQDTLQADATGDSDGERADFFGSALASASDDASFSASTDAASVSDANFGARPPTDSNGGSQSKQQTRSHQ